MNLIINYILRFLLGINRAGAYSSLIGYTSNPNLFHKYRVVIIPSRFFDPDIYGTPESLPKLPLMEIDHVPFLFGTPRKVWVEDTLVIYADILASSYFLLTRYEEIQRREVRDIHGRFPGKESLPVKAGFIHRPIVEEYGKLLRSWLREADVRIAEPKAQISKIWLTHDVDAPFFCRSIRNVLRETVKGCGFLKACKLFHGAIEQDPYYTFPWILEQNQLVKDVYNQRCDTLFFFKTGGKNKYDKPHYSIRQNSIRQLISMLKSKEVLFGLHSSYEAGERPSLISMEKETLDHVWNLENITRNRNHYLRSREPEDFDKLIKAGITEDFTMGYADVCGFRLGTCRPIQWINPITRQLTQLVLHPLTIMDCTLSDARYMGLDYEEALSYCRLLLQQTRQYGGEIVLLWHNTSFATGGYHKQLYTHLLNDLIS